MLSWLERWGVADERERIGIRRHVHCELGDAELGSRFVADGGGTREGIVREINAG